jgi:hypothetical protein
MTHFYLTLPSNSSHQFYPDNTLTEFTTKLASTVELTNEWEVGLAEIMFPRSWHTIPQNEVRIVFDCTSCRLKPIPFDDVDPSKKYHIVVELSGSFYSSMEELLREINRATQEAFLPPSDYEGDERTTPAPTFHFLKSEKRVYITLEVGMIITLPPALESILGFSPQQNPLVNNALQPRSYRGDFAYDLEAGIHALYIYCDLLHFSFLGDIKAPLLRVVNSNGAAGEVITRYYERPRYVPLQKKNFDSIQILIRDDLGQKIQFESGKVLITLHFRRTQSQYFL